jgi:fatty acid-binding protein DegV
VIAAAEAAMPRVGAALVTDSLDLLIRSGRFPGVDERMRGKFMFLRMDDGAVAVGGVFDRHPDVIEAMFRWLQRETAGARVQLAIQHAGTEEERERFSARATAAVDASQVYVCPPPLTFALLMGKTIGFCYCIEA